MSDKIRFYLEKSVAELEDLDRKGLFTKPELSTIMKKRTDFEHRINSRTCKVNDFIKYAEYEMNVEKLRRKRVKRLGKKTGPKITGVSDYAGPKRVLFIYDRGTRRFSGDISLWLLYIEFAKQEKAIHVVTKIFTTLLQLHPTKPQVWILAAKYEMEDNASMKTARSIMQRGLRFNSDQSVMWLEYIKLELIYVSKILARRRLLGLQAESELELAGGNDPHVEISDELTTADVIKADLGSLPEADMSMLGNIQNNPALRGDVALVIFDAAMDNLNTREKKFSLSLQVLQLIDQFDAVDQQHLASHVIGYIQNSDLGESSPKSILLAVTLPIRYVSHDDPTFPDLVKMLLVDYNNSKQKKVLGPFLIDYIDEKFLQPKLEPELDDNLRQALEMLKKKFV
jgi:U3 small nucleolar RNA-associated protein 6